MIEYHADRWGICFAFRLSGSVFPKSLGFAVVGSLLTCALHFVLEKNHWEEDLDIGSKGTTVVSMFTFVLGFLLVFRTQQAYSRWWEGGSLLQELRGEWFNAFSCLVAFGNPSPEKREFVQKFNHQLARLLSMLHGAGLAQVCSTPEKIFDVIDIEDFDNESLAYLDRTFDSCEVALQWIQRLIGDANGKEIIKVAPPILSRVYNQLGNGIVKLSRARKIAKFPIPFPFAQMVTVMLITHFFLASIVCATSIESRAWAGLLSFAVIISFWSMNFIALELEDPFGDDPNDLPLEDMQRELNHSIVAMMKGPATTLPAFDFNYAYHENLHIRRIDFGKNIHNSAKAAKQGRAPDAFEQAEKERQERHRLHMQTHPAPSADTKKVSSQTPPKAVGIAPLVLGNGVAMQQVKAVPTVPPKGDQVVNATAESAKTTEHLDAIKGLEKQLSKAVSLLEKNGVQLDKQTEMQGVMYQLHCDFWGALASLERIPPPIAGETQCSPPAPGQSTVQNGPTAERRTPSKDGVPAGQMEDRRTPSRLEAAIISQSTEEASCELRPLLTASRDNAIGLSVDDL